MQEGHITDCAITVPQMHQKCVRPYRFSRSKILTKFTLSEPNNLALPMRSIECPLFTPIEVFYITTKGNFYHNSHDFQNFLADEVESDDEVGINNSWKHPPFFTN